MKRVGVVLAALALLAGGAGQAEAGLISITPGALAGANVIDFGPIPTFAPIDGQTINGVLFSYLVNGVHSTDAVIDGGPGNTNNITIANVVNLTSGNANSILRMTFPSPETRMGYGYALLAGGIISNGTTVQLFNAANQSLGSLSVTARPDPGFPGGFLGVMSDTPFVRADVTFSGLAGAFAFDNLRFEFVPSDVTAVPEPSGVVRLGMAGASLAGYFGWRRRKPGVAV
jgi:hypothetical protein